MQGWTGCNGLSQHQIITLTDVRNNNTYTVSKLKDGKCWMTQNLNIINTTIIQDNSDLDIPSFIIPKSNPNGFYIGSEAETNNAASDNLAGYYTWFTATAGTNISSGDATRSICPKSWRLPTSTEYKNLIGKYTLESIKLSPPNFSLCGTYYSTGAPKTTGQTDWWSSTASDNNAAYDLRLNHYDVPNRQKFAGEPIRCVYK